MPPSRPANADTPAPPSVSRSAAIVEPSDSVTLPVERRSAKPPSTWKKPPTWIDSVADASISPPAFPSSVNDFVVDGPVFTASGAAS